MKKLLLILCFLIVSMYPAVAANTTPPGTNEEMFYNKTGQWASMHIGAGLCLSSTATDCTPIVSGNNIVTPLGDPWVTPTGDFIVTP
jgi:hypothetical protein